MDIRYARDHSFQEDTGENGARPEFNASIGSAPRYSHQYKTAGEDPDYSTGLNNNLIYLLSPVEV